MDGESRARSDDLAAMEMELAGMGGAPAEPSDSGGVQASAGSVSGRGDGALDGQDLSASGSGAASGGPKAAHGQKFARSTKTMDELGLSGTPQAAEAQPPAPAPQPLKAQKFARTSKTLDELGIISKPAPVAAEPQPDQPLKVQTFARTTKTFDELGISSTPAAAGAAAPAPSAEPVKMQKFARTTKTMDELGIVETAPMASENGSVRGAQSIKPAKVAMKVDIPEEAAEKMKWIMESTSRIQEITEVVWDGDKVISNALTRRRKTESACSKDASQAQQVVTRLLRGVRVRKESSFSEGSVLDMGGELQLRVPGQDWQGVHTVSRTRRQMRGEVVGHLNMHHLMQYAQALREAEAAAIKAAQEAASHSNRRQSMNLIRKTSIFNRDADGSGTGFPRLITQLAQNFVNDKGHAAEDAKPEVKLPDLQRLNFQRYKYPVSIYKGPMSTVYVAIDTVDREPVVLRRYTIRELDQEQALRLGNEIELLERISHTRDPNIVTYKGSFQTGEYIYIVTENCTQGDLLRELTLSRAHSLKEEQVRETILPQLLSALRYLHKRRIAHCDLRPENLFLTNKGHIKLGDFHHAVNLNVGLGTHRLGMIDYMAPEMLLMLTESEKSNGMYVNDRIQGYDEKVDVWQVGVLVYELLTGAPPFEAEDTNVTAALILWGKVEHYPLYITENAIDFIKQCLQTNPKKRPTIHTLTRHPWLQKTMLHQVNNVVKVLERKSTVRERLSYFTWLVPGFKDVRHNVAEVEPRREEAAGEHEYISEKDDGIMLRAMRTVFRTLGLDRNATKQEQEERQAFEHVGETATKSKALKPMIAILEPDDDRY